MSNISELARLNDLNVQTLHRRLRRGVDKYDAVLARPYRLNVKITDEQIIACEKLGLTINNSAIVLNISAQALGQRIKRLGILWRGKKPLNKKRFGYYE